MKNRQIKFRVWNKKSEQWVHGPGHEVNLFGEMILLGGFMRDVSIQDLNDCIACQFTGLKGKNDKEIYEGDVLSHERYLYYGTVIYDMGSFLVSFPSQTGKTIKTFIDLLPSGFEVLGNIFENPDLLKS